MNTVLSAEQIEESTRVLDPQVYAQSMRPISYTEFTFVIDGDHRLKRFGDGEDRLADKWEAAMMNDPRVTYVAKRIIMEKRIKYQNTANVT